MEINTLGDLIKNSANQFGGSPALGFVGEQQLSYSDVYNRVGLVVDLLENCGIQKGDKVAILSSNQPNWGVAFFAITTMGAIVVPILPDFTEVEVENVLVHSEAKAIFISDGLFRKVQDFNAETLSVKILIENFALIGKEISAAGLGGLKSSLSDTEVTIKNYDVDKSDLASIIYTSGTTGKSKGVMLTHNNLVFSAEMSGRIHSMDTTDKMLSVLPLSHTYENTIGFLLPMMYGTSVQYLKKPPVPSVLIPALQQIRPTLMLTVPLIIEKVYKGKILPTFNEKALTRYLYKFAPARKLLNRIAGSKLKKTFGGNLKFFGIGGAKLDPEVERFLIEGKFPYAIGYGLTETSPLLAGFDSYCGKHQSTGPAMQG